MLRYGFKLERLSMVVMSGTFDVSRNRRRRKSIMLETSAQISAPFLGSVAGVKAGPELDGMDLLPRLRGNAGPTERTVFWRSTRWGLQHALRQGNWKYLRLDARKPRSSRPENGELLFDLSRDPLERENFAGRQPEVLDRLRRLYAKWESGMLPPIEPVAAPRPAQP